MKTIIYHANCADGFTAAWIAHEYFNGLVELIPASYGDEVVPDIANKDVYILDFSYSFSVMKAIALLAKSVTWIDHHKTAEYLVHNEEIKSLTNMTISFDMNHSGAMLTWLYFEPGMPTPKLVQYVEDRDMWWFKLPDSKEINAVIASSAKEIEVYNSLSYRLEAHYLSEVDKGKLLLSEYNSMLERILAIGETKITLFKGCSGLSCNAPYMFASDIGNILAKKSGTFGLTYYINSAGYFVFSVRSIGDYDVSEIAQYFGGGGHKNAAGFKLSKHEMYKIWEREL